MTRGKPISPVSYQEPARSPKHQCSVLRPGSKCPEVTLRSTFIVSMTSSSGLCKNIMDWMVRRPLIGWDQPSNESCSFIQTRRSNNGAVFHWDFSNTCSTTRVSITAEHPAADREMRWTHQYTTYIIVILCITVMSFFQGYATHNIHKSCTVLIVMPIILLDMLWLQILW